MKNQTAHKSILSLGPKPSVLDQLLFSYYVILELMVSLIQRRNKLVKNSFHRVLGSIVAAKLVFALSSDLQINLYFIF